MKFNANDAPVLIVLGQSNAHAHGTRLPEDERILVPLKNVYGLSSDYNQAFGLDDIRWSGFTSHGMNLGETQDHMYSLANRFAAKWQTTIDRGAELPDLYVVQISIGAQGIAETEYDNRNMWYPGYPKQITKGPLGTCKVSLYPLTLEIFSLVKRSLEGMGKTMRVIGLHWNQYETEALTGGDSILHAEENYNKLFQGFFKALGSNKKGERLPLYLYRPLCENYKPENVHALSVLFDHLASQYAECKVIDPTLSPLWNATPKTHGIFQPDGVHYAVETHAWFVEWQWKALFEA